MENASSAGFAYVPDDIEEFETPEFGPFIFYRRTGGYDIFERYSVEMHIACLTYIRTSTGIHRHIVENSAENFHVRGAAAVDRYP